MDDDDFDWASAPSPKSFKDKIAALTLDQIDEWLDGLTAPMTSDIQWEAYFIIRRLLAEVQAK